jgi:hypothetical protein
MTVVSSGFSWLRVAAESAAIVASILLAFAIEAWWQERSDRKAELVLLERLQADFIDMQAALRLVEDEHREARDACIYLLSLTLGDAVPATAEVDRMVALVFLTSRTFNPGSGAVVSFISSDGAQLLRNHLLADKLLAWSSLVEELQEEEASLQKGVAERWSPYLASRVSIGPYLAGFAEMRELPSQISIPSTRTPLAVDREFQNHVLDRFKWQQIALRDIEPVGSVIADILALIEKELRR